MQRSKRQRKKRKPRQKRFRRFALTREGRVFLAVALGVGLAAVNTGNNLLYLVLGLMLSLLLLSGTLSDLVLWRISVKRWVPRRIFAATPIPIEIALTNHKRSLPSYALEIEDRLEGEARAPRRCFFLKVSGGTTQLAVYERTFDARGEATLDQIVVASQHPFGLIEKRRRHRRPETVVVFPQLVPVTLREVVGLGAGAEGSSQAAGRGTETLALRDYREGDEARSIHWGRSATLDRFVVRERARDRRGKLILRVDNAKPSSSLAHDDAAWSEGFERAVSKAASLARAALQQGFAVQVQLRGSSSAWTLPSASPDGIFRFLALAQPIAEAGQSFERASRDAMVRVLPIASVGDGHAEGGPSTRDALVHSDALYPVETLGAEP